MCRSFAERGADDAEADGALPAPCGRVSSALEGVIAQAIARLVPDGRVVEVTALGPDRDLADDTHKGAGYGAPRRVRVETASGQRAFVFHVATANEFGHDRRADRAEAQLLAFDTWAAIPRHALALDVGAMSKDGSCRSLADASEFYLVTEWADGAPYAEDLRRIARTCVLGPDDAARCEALARYLVALHTRGLKGPARYRRAIRDLLGHGEGIFGMIDGYPEDTPGAPASRLQEIEAACLRWRWQLRNRSERLTTTHGDFHPFNVVFSSGSDFTLLDASRGCAGDAADDVAAMVVNYVFFALDHPGAWEGGLRTLWRLFWDCYLEASGDDGLLSVIAPFLAWRGLVVASPVFYPDLPATARDRMLGLIERALDAPRFDPSWAEALFP